MKNTMKLCLVMIACMAIRLYSAEKPNPYEIIQRANATGGFVSRTTVNQLMQQQNEMLQQQESDLFKAILENCIYCKQPVPTRIISQADPEIAALALQHNQSLQQQLLHTQEPK